VAFGVITKKIYDSNLLILQKLKAEKEDLEKQKELAKSWEKFEEESKTLKSGFFTEDSLKGFIEENARISMLNISSLRPTRQEQQFYNEGIVDLTMSFSYRDFVNFIKAVERRFVSVERLIITVMPQQTKTGHLKLRGILLKAK
jgi:Tfp pilus assembly protein PilO